MRDLWTNGVIETDKIIIIISTLRKAGKQQLLNRSGKAIELHAIRLIHVLRSALEKCFRWHYNDLCLKWNIVTYLTLHGLPFTPQQIHQITPLLWQREARRHWIILTISMHRLILKSYYFVNHNITQIVQWICSLLHDITKAKPVGVIKSKHAWYMVLVQQVTFNKILFSAWTRNCAPISIFRFTWYVEIIICTCSFHRFLWFMIIMSEAEITRMSLT